jgi:electron transfer flavoprotein beta subunit
MNILIYLQVVPDTVEDLVIASDGKTLDSEYLRTILNEPDDHALEQGLLLKEKYGGTLTVVAFDSSDVGDVLFGALAKGADSALKITGIEKRKIDSHSAARILQSILKDKSYDVILTGVQATDDMDGQVGAMLAVYLRLPYVGVVSGVTVDGTSVIVRKEFPGGVLEEIRVQLPALLGIQSASQPPRYVPVARIRQAMKAGHIEEIRVSDVLQPVEAAVGITMYDGGVPLALAVQRMLKPEISGRAEMISGTPQEIVSRIVGILQEKGLVK